MTRPDRDLPLTPWDDRRMLADPIRVLITDDHARSRNSLRALLATWPEIEVIGEAANGQEALHRVEEWQPDVVLMDARMPLMDGLEATQRIKNKWPEVKIIMLTLYATHHCEALAAGADAFLIKGCPDKELVGTILAPPCMPEVKAKCKGTEFKK